MIAVETKPIALIDDKIAEPPVPVGKVRLTDGRIIDRADVGFHLSPNPKNPNLLLALDGTIYLRLPGGNLKRMTPKKSTRKTR